MKSNLSDEYENSLNESFRNNEGIYYTPENIIKDMLKNIDDVENKIFLDPCCGCGNFIIQAIDKGFSTENIYGFDTDKNAVEITKKRILEKTGFESKNIIVCDFLEFAKDINTKYDFIFTNPPWGKKLKKEIKEKFSAFYKTGKSIDTSALFFFVCLKLLNEGGKLGFLLPEAFFNISTFEDARKAALNLQIERLIDYAKPFKGLLTRAYAIILKNEKVNINTPIICETEKQKIKRNQQSFNKVPKHIFNFWTNDEENKVIEYIFSLPHITLADNAKWGLGIVTGNNNKVCKTTCEPGFVPIFRGQDITSKGLKEPKLYISEDLSDCRQVAPLELYKTNEKLVYRFISNRLVFYCDTKQNYILNSANMLILNKDFPITGQQLSDLLNSSYMNWIFSNIFHTHKILRGDLELLPLHTDYFIKNNTFDEEKYINYINIEKGINGAYRIKK
ncbi:MAG: N-6 DNA methylase [Treponema sp.]|nr:N-6 DNA methylase [Treponema sp.]